MHFLIAIYKYTPYGGLQKDTYRVVREAILAGHRVTVFTTGWEGELPTGANVECVHPKGVSNHRRMWNFSREFLRRLALKDYDVSLAMNRIPGANFYFAADECQKEVLKEKHSRLALALLPRYRIFLKLERETLAPEYSTEILAITQMQIDGFIREYGISPSRIKLLPPGMDERCVRPDDELAISEIRNRLRQSLAIRNDEIVLVIVAANFSLKGGDRVLKAMDALEQPLKAQCHLLVIGDDKVSPGSLASQGNLSPEKIHVLGRRDDVNEWLLASDIMVHPARRESAGSVLIEGLAAGLPVICTENCGFSPIVSKVGGMVIPGPFEQVCCNRILADTIHRLSQIRAIIRKRAPKMDFCSRSRTIVEYLAGKGTHDC